MLNFLNTATAILFLFCAPLTAQIIHQTDLGTPGLDAYLDAFVDTRGQLIIGGNTTDWFDLGKRPHNMEWSAMWMLRRPNDIISNEVRLPDEEKGGWIRYVDSYLEEEKIFRQDQLEPVYFDLAIPTKQSIVLDKNWLKPRVGTDYYSSNRHTMSKMDDAWVEVWNYVISDAEIPPDQARIPEQLEKFLAEYHKGLLPSKIYKPIQIGQVYQIIEQEDNSLLCFASLALQPSKPQRNTTIIDSYQRQNLNTRYQTFGLVHLNQNGVQDWFIPLQKLNLNGYEHCHQTKDRVFVFVQNYINDQLNMAVSGNMQRLEDMKGDIRVTTFALDEIARPEVRIDGNKNDFVRHSFIDQNRNLILIGGTSSTDASFSGNHGRLDVLFARVTPEGLVAATQTIGTQDYDLCLSATPYHQHYALLVEQQSKKIYKLSEREVSYKIYIVDHHGNTISEHAVNGLPINLVRTKLLYSGADQFYIIGNKLKYDGSALVDTDIYVARYQLAK